MKAGKFKDILITSLIKVCGYSAIIFVGMIFVFLIKEGSPALIRVPLENFLQLRWYPIEDRFGLLPLIGVVTDRHARSRHFLHSTRSR